MGRRSTALRQLQRRRKRARPKRKTQRERDTKRDRERERERESRKPISTELFEGVHLEAFETSVKMSLKVSEYAERDESEAKDVQDACEKLHVLCTSAALLISDSSDSVSLDVGLDITDGHVGALPWHSEARASGVHRRAMSTRHNEVEDDPIHRLCQCIPVVRGLSSSTTLLTEG